LCLQKNIIAENIFLDNKYIFVSYEGRCKYIFKGIFDANIFFAEGGKKSIFSGISVSNLRVIYLYKYRPCIILEKKRERESRKTRFGSQQQN